MRSEYYMSSKKMTVWVKVDHDGTIMDTAPITRKFVGQPIGNLVKWLKKQGGFKYEHL